MVQCLVAVAVPLVFIFYLDEGVVSQSDYTNQILPGARYYIMQFVEKITP